MLSQIQKLIDEQISPGLSLHKGAVELIDVDNNRVFIKFTGGCQGCKMSNLTLKQGIERLIKSNFKEIIEVIDLTNHQAGTQPFYK